MTRIVVRFKDDRDDKEFPESARAGGSWDNSVRYVDGMVIVTDAWEHQWAYQQRDVLEVQVFPRHGW